MVVKTNNEFDTYTVLLYSLRLDFGVFFAEMYK